MKYVLILFVVSLSTTAFAGPADLMCKLMAYRGYSSDANSCYQTVNGKSFNDPNALYVCSYANFLDYRSFTISCLSYIANKTFQAQGQMENCLTLARRGHRSDALECLQTTPQTTNASNNTSSDSIIVAFMKEEIEKAIEALEDEKYSEAEVILHRALRKAQ